MAINTWTIIGVLGLAAIGGLAFYAFQRDKKDPFGVIEDIWNDNFVEGGKFIVPRTLRGEDGSITPRNLDFKRPDF